MHHLCLRLSAISFCFLAAAAHAQDGAVHEHGASHIDAVLDGSTLQVALHGPGHNFVGFEHAAQTSEEKQQRLAAQAKLKAADTLFVLPAQAACTLANVSLAAATENAGDHEAHNDGHAESEHAHPEHPHGDHAHNDWRADYTFQCGNPKALKQIDVQVFTAFPQTEQIRFQLLAPAAQSGGTLDAASTIMTVPQP